MDQIDFCYTAAGLQRKRFLEEACNIILIVSYRPYIVTYYWEYFVWELGFLGYSGSVLHVELWIK